MTRMPVIDLTQRVDPRCTPEFRPVSEAIFALFEGLDGMMADVDGTLAHFIEPLHREFWLGGLVRVARDALSVKYSGAELERRLNPIRTELKEALDRAFSNGGFIMGPAYEILRTAQALPEGPPSLEQLDQLVGTFRIPLIEGAIDEGRVQLMVDTAPFFDFLRRVLHVRIGIYTNSDRYTGSTICRRLFGAEQFDWLIRETPDKPRRLYGSDVPKDKRKPHPYGWGVLARNMDCDPPLCGLMEDRLNVIQAAFEAHPFRFAVLVVAPDHPDVDPGYEAKLQRTREELETWSGPPIIMVRDLALLREVLVSGRESGCVSGEPQTCTGSTGDSGSSSVAAC